jgi:predicted O-methyltransferase YrrM
VLRDRVKQALVRAGRTGAGRNAIHAAVCDDPRQISLRAVTSWPETLDGFEDLAFLFSSNQLNHGVASLQVDEAALLYRHARGREGATFAEIGRFRGGSTLLFASALGEGSTLWSYDIGPADDAALTDALRRYGVEERVRLVVADSRTIDPPPEPLDLLFVDGDHRYEGVKADTERWLPFVRPGGVLLFHDAVPASRYGLVHEGVARYVGELTADPRVDRTGGAGSIAEFTARG